MARTVMDVATAHRVFGLPLGTTLEDLAVRREQLLESLAGTPRGRGERWRLDLAWAAILRAAAARFHAVQEQLPTPPRPTDDALHPRVVSRAPFTTYELRPTDGGRSLVAYRRGVRQFMLVRSRQQPNVFAARDAEGRSVRLNGVRAWREVGDCFEPVGS